MVNLEDKGQESTEDSLIEDIYQLKRIALGEGVVACQVCGSSLSGGSAVTVFAYRPAGEPAFEVGHVLCGNEHKLPTYFTLGVRELIVDGHIGRCVDPTTQASWPVLLEPSVRVVSKMDSKTGQIAPTSSTDSSSEVSWVYGDALLKRATDHETTSGSDSESQNSPTKPTVADGMGQTNENTTPTGGKATNTTNPNPNPNRNGDRDGHGDEEGDGTGGEC